jgi:hypothetical protein
MQFSSASYHYIPLRSKYSPKHPVVEYCLVCVLPLTQQSFKLIQNNSMVYNYSFVYFNLHVFRQQMKRQDSELHDSKHSLLHLNAEEKCNQVHGKLQVAELLSSN